MSQRWMTAVIAVTFFILPANQGIAQQVGYGVDRITTPVNQVLTPYGEFIQLPGLRPQGLALSPDGQLLAVSGKTAELLIFRVQKDGQLEMDQRVPLPADKQTAPLGDPGNALAPDRDAQISYTGLIFSPDGDTIWLSNVNGSIKVFKVEHVEGKQVVAASHSIPLPPAAAPRRSAEIPAGLAVSRDRRRLYVCGNLSNQLLEIDVETGKVVRTFPCGVAPYDVLIVDEKAFVTNWGGRRPKPGDLVGPAGRGTTVRVDPVRHVASEGSVSVVDLVSGKVLAEIVVGLHASGLAVSPDKRFVVCANAGSDTLSVIDVKKLSVIETIWTKPSPNDLFGAAPNAIAFGRDADELWVANGSHNAIGRIEFEPLEKGESRLTGLVPVGWYPGSVVYDARRDRLVVANIKGLSESPKEYSTVADGFNSHHYQGSLSVFPIPRDEAMVKRLSEKATINMRSPAIAQALLPPRKNVSPKAIPQRIGEPSPIKHVVYVIKENRTYDQVLGDIREGNGDPVLCIFGKKVTPNQHRLAREFVLLDNTYCAGILSADGHQWSTTAMSTDYMEKSFAGFPRSYPDGMGDDDVDALAYSPAGFIWDNAAKHGVSIRNYGEFMIPRVRWRDSSRAGTPSFMDCFRTWKGESDAVHFESEAGIESIRKISPTKYVGWEMSVPDQYRADFVIRELKEFEAKSEFPNLVIICLPNDHTSGTSPGAPTPESCMADNDLALGRIVDALTHSTFWPKMAIFVIEDDPQAGWDHVSGYRTTAYCISPYVKRGAVVSTYYNTTSVLRTIEQILGMPPMNIFDASATPMFDCFHDKADLRPYTHVANNIPLDQLNPSPQSLNDPQLRQDAFESAEMNFLAVDRAPEDRLNRILWRSVKGSDVPYPEWAVTVVEDDDDDDDWFERNEQ